MHDHMIMMQALFRTVTTIARKELGAGATEEQIGEHAKKLVEDGIGALAETPAMSRAEAHMFELMREDNAARVAATASPRGRHDVH